MSSLGKRVHLQNSVPGLKQNSPPPPLLRETCCGRGMRSPAVCCANRKICWSVEAFLPGRTPPFPFCY